MGLTTILGGFILSLLLAVLFTRTAIVVGTRAGIVDKPDGYRKTHKRVVPRIGGVAVMFAIVLPALVLLVFFKEIPITVILASNLRPLMICFAGAVLAMGLGLLDDIFDIRPLIKIAGQIVIASAMYYLGFKITAVINPLTKGDIFLGFLAFPVTVLWFLVCMNIVNLLDGIDGLAAGACAFVGVTLFFLSLNIHNHMGMFLMACFTGGILGFLFFNFPPASIFLGDSGSLVLGYFIASLTLLGGIRKADAAVALFIPLVALGLPLLDTSLAIIRRWYKRLPIASSDRMHIHHRLVKALGETRALLTMYVICVFLLGAAMLVMTGSNEMVLFVLIILSTIVFVCFRFFSGIKVGDIVARFAEAGARREKRAAFMAKVYRTINMMGSAVDNDAIWVLCKDLFKELGLETVSLQIGTDKGWTFQSDSSAEPASEGTVVIDLPLRIGPGTPADVCFAKKLSKSKSSAVDSEMLMILRDGLEKYFKG